MNELINQPLKNRAYNEWMNEWISNIKPNNG